MTTTFRTSLGVSAIVRLRRSCGYQPVGAVGMVINQAPNGKHRYWVMFPGMPFARSLSAEDLEVVQGVQPHSEWWQSAPVELPAQTPLRRLRACVDAWPDCHTGGYNPSCCRWPKSCSATVYDPEQVDDADLEDA